jgi:hypothetical protein
VSNTKKAAKLSTTKLNLKAQNIDRSLVHYSTNFANAVGKLLLITDQRDQRFQKKIPNISKSCPNSVQSKKDHTIHHKAQFEIPKHLQITSPLLYQLC